MVPGFEALAAVLSVLSRGADGGRVFRILSGKYPEYLAENSVPFRGRERYRPWQAMRGHTARALARGLRPPLHPRRGLPPSGFCSGGLCAERARGVCGGFCYLMGNKVTEAPARSPTNGSASGITGAVQLPQTNALVRLSIQESVH
jgi:hypothetical protein